MSRTVILWAGSVPDSSGVGSPDRMLGEPNALDSTIGEPGSYATLTSFRGRFYSGLSALLSTVRFGQTVTPEMLATADLIAFEDNGGSPGESGGWESCEWFFGDGTNALSVHWDAATSFYDPVRMRYGDPHIVATGSITGAAYSAFFGFPTANFLGWGGISRVEDIHPEDLVASFLLIKLRPEIDIASPYFKVRISASTLTPEPRVRSCSPDPDAIGILACHHEDDESTRGK